MTQPLHLEPMGSGLWVYRLWPTGTPVVKDSWGRGYWLKELGS